MVAGVSATPVNRDVHAGSAVVALPARRPDDNQKPTGLNWEYHGAGANPGWRSQFRIRGSRLLVPGGSAWSFGEVRLLLNTLSQNQIEPT